MTLAERIAARQPAVACSLCDTIHTGACPPVWARRYVRVQNDRARHGAVRVVAERVFDR